MPDVTISMRRRLKRELRLRVAGPDADQHAERIWGTPGPRWFRPEDPVWRVHDDAAMFCGGIRALLVQSLHPLAMAAVADHSGYRGDPWGRLARTSRFLATTTFGTIEHAQEAVEQVRAVHAGVTGQTPDGRTYRASDPVLLRWVHVAEVESFLTTHQVYGRSPLTPAECDDYVAQASLVAELLGAADPPRTVAQLRRCLTEFHDDLEMTAAAQDTVDFLLQSPPVPRLARGGYGMLATGAVSTLPGWARRMLGLRPPHPVRDAPRRAAGRRGVQMVRWVLESSPEK